MIDNSGDGFFVHCNPQYHQDRQGGFFKKKKKKRQLKQDCEGVMFIDVYFKLDSWAVTLLSNRAENTGILCLGALGKTRGLSTRT